MKTGLKRRTAYLFGGIMLVASLSACSLSKEKENGNSTGDTSQNNVNSQDGSSTPDITTMVNENTLLNVAIDSFYKEDTTIEILAENGEFVSKGRGVVVDGNTVTIKSEGCYRLTGVMENGQVIVDADNGTDIRLVLGGFEIHNDSGAAIYVANAGTIEVTLEAETENIIGQSGATQDSEELQDAALYSTDDLVINGTGSLTVFGNYCHGIKAKDTLLLAEAMVEVTSKEDAINANMDLLVDSGTYLLSAGDDGIHTDTNLTIRGGDINISKSYEGLEGMQVWMEDGKVSLVSSDDAINIASNTTTGTAAGGEQRDFGRGQFGGMGYQDTSGFILVVSGGSMVVQAGGDGIDSNGSILMTGGKLEISGPTNSGNGSLDYAGSCTVQGGTFTMAGASGMAQTPGNNSEQVGVMIYFESTMSAGTTISLKDEDCNEIVSMTPTVSYQCAYLSAPEMEKGETYTLWQDDAQVCEMTMNTTINYYSSSGAESQGGFGGFGGGMGQGGFGGGMGQGGFGGGMNQGGFDGRGQDGGRMQQDRELPEDMTPPEGMELPEDMTPPNEI